MTYGIKSKALLKSEILKADVIKKGEWSGSSRFRFGNPPPPEKSLNSIFKK
jgi:hypothetical protein